MNITAEPYRVLARRYRPQTLGELVGQDVAVRILTRAMSSGRIAHAYLLTGIRGVGKTSLARIIAKSLCCELGPTPNPCGNCRHCVAITADNHPDVTEVDAASKTGVDDVRAIVDSTRYMPVDARYRIYIIDEVHMISRGAANALLKTLEEPTPEVVFILATTDPEKLPKTIISRCQRHELRRVPVSALSDHYRQIAQAEGFTAHDAALEAIAEASDGSVRDGLSMLDQAMSLGETITEELVLDMFGAGDRGRIFEALDAALCGDAAGALAAHDDLYACGADPVSTVATMLGIVHRATRARVDAAWSSRADDRPWATNYPVLVRAWQMLLKGAAEVQTASRPDTALEMLLVRLATAADLPTPADVIKMTLVNPTFYGTSAHEETGC